MLLYLKHKGNYTSAVRQDDLDHDAYLEIIWKAYYDLTGISVDELLL